MDWTAMGAAAASAAAAVAIWESIGRGLGRWFGYYVKMEIWGAVGLAVKDALKGYVTEDVLDARLEALVKANGEKISSVLGVLELIMERLTSTAQLQEERRAQMAAQIESFGARLGRIEREISGIWEKITEMDRRRQPNQG